MKIATALTPLLIVGMISCPASADKGSIPFRPNVRIFEPNQRAMIAWDGREEILLLTTDLMASEPTKILEVIPLPNEPQVSRGEVEVFRKATTLINQKLRQAAMTAGGRKVYSESTPAGEVTFHKKIGAHDVTVAHVMNGGAFIDWVNAYLRKAGVENPVIPAAMTGVIEEYIREGFAWFVFDVVELDNEPRTNEALQYSFKTNRLFYPLKISRTDQGATSIELLVLTPRLLSRFSGIPSQRVELLHEPFTLTADELRSLSQDMADLLCQQSNVLNNIFWLRENDSSSCSEAAKLRIWRIRGDLSSFHQDLVVH